MSRIPRMSLLTVVLGVFGTAAPVFADGVWVCKKTGIGGCGTQPSCYPVGEWACYYVETTRVDVGPTPGSTLPGGGTGEDGTTTGGTGTNPGSGMPQVAVTITVTAIVPPVEPSETCGAALTGAQIKPGGLDDPNPSPVPFFSTADAWRNGDRDLFNRALAVATNGGMYTDLSGLSLRAIGDVSQTFLSRVAAALRTGSGRAAAYEAASQQAMRSNVSLEVGLSQARVDQVLTFRAQGVAVGDNFVAMPAWKDIPRTFWEEARRRQMAAVNWVANVCSKGPK